MTIRNKDGSTYKLNGPNPLASQQANWEDNIVLHNLKWQPIELPNKDELPAIAEIKKPEEVKATEEPKLVPTPPSSSINTQNIVLMHCLTATTKVTKDELYGEEKRTLAYGEKLILEGLVVDQNDLIFDFWTVVDLGIGSILYPYQHKDGRSIGDFRWWKVNSTEPKAKGFLIHCVLSGYQPHFS